MDKQSLLWLKSIKDKLPSNIRPTKQLCQTHKTIVWGDIKTGRLIGCGDCLTEQTKDDHFRLQVNQEEREKEYTVEQKEVANAKRERKKQGVVKVGKLY